MIAATSKTKAGACLRISVSGALAAGFLCCAPRLEAQFGNPFNFFKREKEIPSLREKQAQDAAAATLFSQAHEAYHAGDQGRALALFRKIAKQYPESDSAAESQFRVGEIYRSIDEPVKAFRAYEELVKEHPESARFATAVKHEYELASACVDEKKGSFLFIPKRVSREQVIKMFESIIESAPQSEYAPLSQYQVGRVHEDVDRRTEAIDAYQKVVDNYPTSSVAPDAQLRVAKIMEYLGTRYRDRDPARLARRREAYEDFLTNYPDHEASEQARAVIGTITDQEAKKSLKIGKYYDGKGNLKAAAIYYRDAMRVEEGPTYTEAATLLEGLRKRDPEAARLAEVESARGARPSEESENAESLPGGGAEEKQPASSLKEALERSQRQQSPPATKSRWGLKFPNPAEILRKGS